MAQRGEFEVGEVGVALIIDVSIDVSELIVASSVIRVHKPDGTTVDLTVDGLISPIGTTVQHTFIASEVDVAGDWIAHPRLNFPSAPTVIGKAVKFRVFDEFEV